ncbi:MAG: SHD1 domain-containing protein [Thermoguttaceae bacterium]|nr:SHD1 domain-containing protein [Thermoguttaceae bacterium]
MNRRLLHCTVGVVVGVFVSGLLVAPAVAADPPELRYGFETDRDYIYDVTIAGEITDRKSTHKGALTYRAAKVSDSQFVLECSGMLAETVTTDDMPAMPPIPPIPPFHFRGGPMHVWGRGTSTTFSRTGTLISTKSDNFLPFVLGLQDVLVVEPLPEKPQATWTAERDIAVVERMSVGPFFSRLRSFYGEVKTIGKERTEYSVVEQKDGVVRIRKTYSLKTLPDEGVVRFDMSGDGEFEFDTAKGIILSQKAEYKIQVNEKNLTLTIPASVSYRLVSESEMAERKQQKEDEAAARAEAERPTPLEPGEREKLIAELRSGNEQQILAAAQRLAKAPATGQRTDVGRALIAAMKDHRPDTQKAIIQALGVWRIPEAERAMIAALRGRHAAFVGRDALAVLAKFRTTAAAQAAAASLASSFTRRAAGDALVAIGPIAEEFTIPFVKDRDHFVSSEACRVLGEIGGEASLVALKQQLLESRDRMGTRDITRAIDDIERRGGQPPVMLEEDDDELAGPASDAVMRTWHDATRSFQIEAQLLKFENDQVTLRRQDGRVITLPLAKLCEEDREFVKQQATAVNPFD